MNTEYLIETLGQPDLQVAGLQLWIHGRERPESQDYWDGNWLIVTVYCCAPGSDVWVGGSILHLSELHHWLVECESMYVSLSGEANMECMEPNFSVKLQMTTLGYLNMWVSITPNNVSQEHRFLFEIDQSYLMELIQGLKTIFRSYSIRDFPVQNY